MADVTNLFGVRVASRTRIESLIIIVGQFGILPDSHKEDRVRPRFDNAYIVLFNRFPTRKSDMS